MDFPRSSIFPRPTTSPTIAAVSIEPNASGTRVGEPTAQGATQATVTNPPNFFQNVQHAIGGAFTNLLQPLRPTTAPAAAAADVPKPSSADEPTVIKGTRVGEDETVEVVENIEIVDGKVDLSKAAPAPNAAPVPVPVPDVTKDAAPVPTPAVAVPASTQ